MKNILVVPNLDRDPNLFYTKQALSCLKSRAVFVNNAFAPQLSGLATPLPDDQLYQNIDMIIALGGDGTLLSVARQAAALNLPVLGINLGHLGFLAEIEKHEIEQSLAKLCAGDYSIEKRIMLSASLSYQNGKTIVADALNDVVVSRSQGNRLIDIILHVGNEFVDDYKADGMIVATPTGSTAYSMSAGGPILDPAVKSFVITPICPHKLYSKTIVAPDDVEITMTISNQNPRPAMVSCDGQNALPFSKDDVLTLRRSSNSAQLVKINGSRFYSVLQHKLLGKEK